MRIHCPHCLEETELDNSVHDSVVTCKGCKAVFDPRKKETLPNAAPAGDARPELLPGICAGDGFGGYVLEKRLGKGGMGIVFAATQLSLGRKVAIKVLAHDLLKDPEFVQRFDREARVLASLNHPNIVQVIDKGIERGHVYLVMELVDGVSLRDVLAEKKLPPGDALKIIPQLCDALEYAHTRGVVHRDIKPENILVGRDGGVKIADFGLARIVGEGPAGRITRSNAVMGSLDYMAPEQRERTRDADHRADIYALGVVFYEMLTGELPIGRFEPPSKKVQLDVNIDEVVLRVLAKDPEARYQRASDVGAEIRRRTGEAAAGAGAPGCETDVLRAAFRGRGALCEALDRWAEAPVGARIGPLNALFWPAFGLFIAAATSGIDVFAIPAGVLLGMTLVLAVWLKLLPRVEWQPGWGTYVDPANPRKWRRLPRPLGEIVCAAILIMIFLPRPVDLALVSALLPIGLAVYSESPRLFRKKEEVNMAQNGASALPSELAHLAVPLPAAPAGIAAAPPRPRLSLLALLGFLLGGALFVAGTAAAVFTAWASDHHWVVLDEGLRDAGGRRAIEEAVAQAAPPEARAAIFTLTAVSLTVCALVLALNGGTLLSVGRRVGLRGAGYAFMGLLLSGIAALEVAAVSEKWRAPLARWQQLENDPNLLAASPTPSADRLEDLLRVSAISRRGAEGLPLLKLAVESHPAPSVRYGAAYALGRAMASENPAEREVARTGLDAGLKDRSEAVREISKWGLEDPATRSKREPQPRKRYRIEAQGSAF